MASTVYQAFFAFLSNVMTASGANALEVELVINALETALPESSVQVYESKLLNNIVAELKALEPSAPNSPLQKIEASVLEQVIALLGGSSQKLLLQAHAPIVNPLS